MTVIVNRNTYNHLTFGGFDRVHVQRGHVADFHEFRGFELTQQSQTFQVFLDLRHNRRENEKEGDAGGDDRGQNQRRRRRKQAAAGWEGKRTHDRSEAVLSTNSQNVITVVEYYIGITVTRFT